MSPDTTNGQVGTYRLSGTVTALSGGPIVASLYVPSESWQIDEADTAVELGPLEMSFNIEDYKEYSGEIQPMFFMQDAAQFTISELKFEYLS